MSTLKGNATLPTPEVLLRFILYSDSSCQAVTQLAPDAWVDFNTAFGPKFQAGTEHKVSLVNPDRKLISYKVVVAKAPVLEQKPNPEETGEMIPIAMLYLMPAAA